MSLTKVTDEWVPLQIKVFTRWVNGHLKSINDDEVEDITKDLSTGVHLVNLAQVLTQKEPPLAWKKEPKMQVFMVQNCDLAIEMFKNDGVQLVGISGKDINDNNVKLILGLIWTLILTYSIDKSISSASFGPAQNSNSNSSKNALMNWAVKKTAEYPNINPNFQPYDLSMCALLDSYVPDKINYHSLSPDETEKNAQLATDVMNELGIPVYIYPDDVIKSGNQVDDKTLLTQLSSAKVVLDNLSKARERAINIEENDQTKTLNKDEKTDFEYMIREEHNQLRIEIQNIQEEIHQLESSKNEDESSKVAIKCLKYEVKQLKKAIEGKSTITSVSDESSQVIQLPKEDLEQISKGREEDKAEIERLKKELSELRTQITNTNNENNSLREKIDSLSNEFNNNKNNSEPLPEVKERSITLNDTNDENQSPLNKDEYEKFLKEREEYKSEIEHLKNDLSELRTQITNTNNENSSLKEKIDSLSNGFNNNKNNSEPLPEVKERSATLNGNDENEQLRKDVQSLQSELQALKSKTQSDGTKLYIFVFIILIVLLICIKLSK